MRQLLPALILLVVVPSACKTAPPPSATPTGPTSPTAAVAPQDPAAKPAWANMDAEAKKGHMMDAVTPTMAALFQAVNPERYGEFTCVTCHGPGANKGEFAMPSPSLPKLPANGDFSQIMAAKPDVMKFMGQQVVPKMAELLDTPAYDPATHAGFGCFGCHQKAG